MEITCPSGLRGEIRGMKGREAQAFVDPALARTHGSMDAMLSNCFLAVTDAGIYKLVDPPPKSKTTEPRLDWKRVLMGDRFHAAMEIRAATFGQEYAFFCKCESCGEKYGWELNLCDLERRKLPEASAERLRAGTNRFELSLPDGKILAFKLATGEEEIAIAKMKGPAGSSRKLGPVDAVFAQTIAIYVPEGDDLFETSKAEPVTSESGVRMKPIPGGPIGCRRYLDDVDFGDLQAILEEMQTHDCGVETKIETICEFCNWQQEIELPFQRSFFERPKRKKAED